MTNQTNIAADAAMVAAYAAASVGEKNRMRSAIGDAIGAAVVAAASGDVAALARAASLVATRDAFGPTTVTVTPDYAATIADMRATLVAAIAAIDTGAVVMPDGVAVPVGPVSPNGTADAATVTRLTTVTGRKVGRGDVPAYVARALAVTGDGATATDLHRAWTADIGGDRYPTSGPSVGAIGAAFVRVIDGVDGADDYGWTVTTNAAGTRVANAV